jgi:OmpA-OmpF porin, OOP family
MNVTRFAKPALGVAATVLALGAASSAFAQQAQPQLPFYFGGAIGGGHLNRSGNDLTGLSNASVDTSDTAWTVRAGWRFMPWLAVELGYYDLGKYNFSGTQRPNIPVNGTAKATSTGLSLVGILPIDAFDIYGRIGYAHSQLKLDANTPNFSSGKDDSQDEATYGVGGRWTFTRNWAVFAEWMKNDKIRVDGYVLGIDFRF